jgi:hypothetical protein
MLRNVHISYIVQSSIWRFFLILGSFGIVLYSLIFTLNLVEQLKVEEYKRIELVAEAIKSAMNMMDNDITFQSQMIESNTTIPMMIVDANDQIEDVKNYNKELKGNISFFKEELKSLKLKTKPIIIESKEPPILKYIFYRQSKIISYLELVPYIQFSLLALFFMLIVFTFSAIRKSQQEQIWVGMAKETAHQLGTPISSLIGWIENIKVMYPEDDNLKMISSEMYRDIEMLEIVAGRFSKIGALPELSTHNIYERLNKHYQYIKQRAPRKINLEFPDTEEKTPLLVKINPLLFDWVIENLLKNSLDAMDGKGLIKVEVGETEKHVFIDVTDSGKGIPKSMFNKIFKPGYSTKKRGWGLGLSLCKRIIYNYHKGKIFVKNSVLNQGTTFRVLLPKI